jgi:hypothetical protein
MDVPLPKQVTLALYILKGVSTFPSGSILQNDLVYNFAAEDASPAEEFLSNAVKLLVNHCPVASVTFHGNPPNQLILLIFEQVLYQDMFFFKTKDNLASSKQLNRWREIVEDGMNV